MEPCLATRRTATQRPSAWGHEEAVVEVRVKLDPVTSAQWARERVPNSDSVVFPNAVSGGDFVVHRAASLCDVRAALRPRPCNVRNLAAPCSRIGVLWPARLDSLGPILQPRRNDFRSTGSTRSPFRQPRPVDWQPECCQGKDGRLGHWSRVRDGSHTFRKRRKASARQRPENAVRARLRIRSAGSPAFLIILVGPGQYAAAGIKGIRGKV